jgi:hypothetical protein
MAALGVAVACNTAGSRDTLRSDAFVAAEGAGCGDEDPVEFDCGDACTDDPVVPEAWWDEEQDLNASAAERATALALGAEPEAKSKIIFENTSGGDVPVEVKVYDKKGGTLLKETSNTIKNGKKVTLNFDKNVKDYYVEVRIAGTLIKEKLPWSDDPVPEALIKLKPARCED